MRLVLFSRIYLFLLALQCLKLLNCCGTAFVVSPRCYFCNSRRTHHQLLRTASYYHSRSFTSALKANDVSIEAHEDKSDESTVELDLRTTTTSESALHRMRRDKIRIRINRKKLYLASMFALWYVLSIAYNIFSKRSLNIAGDLPYTTAWWQINLGIVLYALPLWSFGLRDRPPLDKETFQRLAPVSFWHSLVHLGGVVSMGAGAVSFTYIVKASEPAVSAALSAILLHSFLPLPVYATLLPVMGGVALASVSELSFSWKAFGYSMMSNVASAMRGITGKKTLQSTSSKEISPVNAYAVLTILSSLFLLPAAVVMEHDVWKSSWTMLRQSNLLTAYVRDTVLASLFHYAYNEVAFLCLDKVTPVSHALASTLKRVFIIFSSILVFGNKITPRGMVGSTVAVLGVLLYSLAKERYDRVET